MSDQKRSPRIRPSATAPQSAFIVTVAQAGHSAATGKQAVEGSHRTLIATAKGVRLLGSWDMDAAYRKLEPHSPRWDYALAVQRDRECLYWVEVHPASSTGQVDEMLAKLKWVQAKLDEPLFAALNQLTKATQARELPPFRWLCTGSYRLGLNSQGLRKLASAGLQAPERKIILS
jgi:hypothetical protein